MLASYNALIVYAGLFIGVLLLVEGFYRLVVDVQTGPRARINRRMTMLQQGSDPRQVLQALRRQRSETTGLLAFADRLFGDFDRMISQAGLGVSPARLLVRQMALAGVIFLCLALWTALPKLAATAVGAALGLGLPLLYIQARRRRRLKLFGEQLPTALDLLVRSLRVGHPLSASLGIVAQELPDPIGSEFGIVVDEVTYGLDLQEAIDNLGDRVDVPDLRYMTVAINIQYESGGNLAEVLAGLAKVIRDRLQMFRKIKAVSAEGRMSAVFLSVFPFILAGLLWTINPKYYQQVSDDPLFPILAGLTVVLLIINIFVMRWLVNFKV